MPKATSSGSAKQSELPDTLKRSGRSTMNKEQLAEAIARKQ